MIVGDTRTDEADHGKAKSNVADAIVKDPDVACLVGIWSYNGPAIRDALKDAGKLGKIKVVCFDEEPGTLDGIKDGSISATIVQHPYLFGKEAVEMMAKYIRGDKTVVPADKLKIIPTRIITSSNLGEFQATLAKERS